MNKELAKGSRKPWDFDPEIDTLKSYDAFCTYRDLGTERSCAAAAQILGKSPTAVAALSAKGNWQERVFAYDLDFERIQRYFIEKSKIQEHKNKLFRYISFCKNLGWANLEIAADCLEVCQKSLKVYKEEPHEKLKPFELKALSSAGISSAEIGQKLLSEALAVEKLLEMMPIDVDSEEVES